MASTHRVCVHHLVGSSPRSPRPPRETFRSSFMSDFRRSGEHQRAEARWPCSAVILAEARWSLQRRHPCGSEVALAAPSSLRKRGGPCSAVILAEARIQTRTTRALASRWTLASARAAKTGVLDRSNADHAGEIGSLSFPCSYLGEPGVLCERSSSSLQPWRACHALREIYFFFTPTAPASSDHRGRAFDLRSTLGAIVRTATAHLRACASGSVERRRGGRLRRR